MKAILGVGVPGSGKTTYLKPLAAELGYAYICPDDVRLELTGDIANHSMEPQVWATVYSRLTEALRRGGVVVDATNAKQRDRCQMVEHCQQNGAAEIIAYWFNLPLAVCLERNNSRQRVVPEHVIISMYNRLKQNPPTKQEGFSEVIEISE